MGGETAANVQVVLELVGFGPLLAGAALVITGEGALDEQTLHGKAPAGVALAAALVLTGLLALARSLDV